MLNSETLEVAIGMSFLFLLMSLICSAVKEWLEGVLKWRAMDLERALRTLLDDRDGATTALLFQHPMISSLFQGHYDASKLKSSSMTPGQGAMHMRLGKRRHLPSYIPAENFAAALIDLVGRGPASDYDTEYYATSLTVDALRERAAALQSQHLRHALLAAIDHAGGNLERVKLNVQRWFDGTMDRASGWYKRRTQAVLFAIGLGTAVVINVDALHVMGRLTADKTFRDAVVQQAEAAKPPGAGAPAPAQDLKEVRALLDDVGIPVGWAPGRPESSGNWPNLYPRQLCKTVADGYCIGDAPHTSVLRVLLGWLVTAFAIMLGAPFWFDVLNKIMVIRSTVKPHEKSREEGSEDRPDKDAKPDRRAASNAAPPPAPSPAEPSPAPAAAPAAPAVFEPHGWREGFSNPGEVKL